MSARSIEVLATPDALAQRAADLVVALAADALAARGRFVVALAGGSTPEKAYRLLAQTPGLDWTRWHVLFGDERYVGSSDPRSNYHMARNALLQHVPIPEEQVYPILPSWPTAAEEAVAYERRVGHLLPDLDLLLLGLGDDGHTLSLFPGQPALAATTLVTWSPPGVLPPPVDRVTLTFRAANLARNAVFLVSGAGKAATLARVLDADADARQLPAAGIQPVTGSVTWLVDAAAAAALPA